MTVGEDSGIAHSDEHVAHAAKVRAIDFSQPNRFTPELRRRIATALDPFCDALGVFLSNELKTTVELGEAEIVQHTWAAAKSRLAADSIAVAVDAKGGAGGQMLVSIELPLVLQALECLLGGTAAQAPRERRLTEIDWVLAGGLVDAIVSELSESWEALSGPRLTRGALDIEGDAGVSVGVAEPTVSATVSCSIDGLESSLSILIPWATVEPIADGLQAFAAKPDEDAGAGGEALRRGLEGVQVLLRAEVGAVQLPIERMLALAPGVELSLDDRAEDGVQLFAEGISLGRGKPGRSAAKRAIKLSCTSDHATPADTYATRGRAEVERARAHADSGSGAGSGGILRSIFVRVWAELGRTHLTLGDALQLVPGAVVELDQSAEAPVELFANGMCFASGSLIVDSDGSWGVKVEELLAPQG